MDLSWRASYENWSQHLPNRFTTFSTLGRSMWRNWDGYVMVSIVYFGEILSWIEKLYSKRINSLYGDEKCKPHKAEIHTDLNNIMIYNNAFFDAMKLVVIASFKAVLMCSFSASHYTYLQVLPKHNSLLLVTHACVGRCTLHRSPNTSEECTEMYSTAYSTL